MTRRRGLGAAVAAVAMSLLVALAIGARHPALAVLLLGAVGAIVWLAGRAVPASPHLAATLAVCVPVYTAFYAAAIRGGFPGDARGDAALGHVLPVAALGASLWVARARIAEALGDGDAGGPSLGHGGLVVGVLAAIAVGALALADAFGTLVSPSAVILTAGVAAATVVAAGIVPLIRVLHATGQVFAVFVAGMARRLVPVFAFLLVYSLLVVVFACVYSILDEVTTSPNFSVLGAARAMSFGEALYFSMITLSTIGFGDIVPVSGEARVLVVVQILFGIVLVLFAFAEIASYEPAPRPRPATRPPPDDAT
jgi:voltage-gated potassium channel